MNIESMSKNKIVFLALWIIVLIFFIILALILNSKSAKKTWWSQKDTFSIWLIWDDKTKFDIVLNDFKKKVPVYKNSTFQIISFHNYEEYYNSLMWSFLNGKTPDIFSLNNNDSPFFDGQILWLDANVINPDEFRKNHEVVFSHDLIRKMKVENKEVEFLAWVPLWYETLGLFYNFREVKWKNLSTWSYINDVIRELSNQNGSTWIWIWNGSTVSMVEDIITQMFLLDGIDTLSNITPDKLKSSLSNYFRFGDETMDNKYDKFYKELMPAHKTNLNLFSAGDIQMILWYPRILEDIDKNGFNKSFLRADVFPTYSKDKWKLLVNYNYLVVNKNTKNTPLALDLMRYLGSSEGQKKYLETFAYYMPTMLSLLEKRLEENVKEWYSIKYKDFYNKDLELTTFNKWMRTIYDKEVSLILDSPQNGVDLFDILRKRLLCMSSKIITWEGLETSCK